MAECNKEAARSVHLCYENTDDVQRFYNEVTVRESHPGTYFCSIGFEMGYFGIQELCDGSKVAIFSVWDAEDQENVRNVNDKRKVKVVYEGDPGVQVSRFGNEGTGGKSMCPYEWHVGEKNKLMVECNVENDETTFTGFFHDNKTQQWKQMAAFRTISKGKQLKGIYSFIEDFRRDYKSYGEYRSALFGNCWNFSDGKWNPVYEATFSADGSDAVNINAKCVEEQFCIETGSKTENVDIKLWEAFKIECPSCPPETCPRMSGVQAIQTS